jgi:diaminohydroxyphosphoribosylaminopyrimidine deaminase/5-amino-6-(5-phosphoribosylamino)uracil reductase
MVEGGSVLLKAFISRGLWDEARVFCSKQMFHDGIRAPDLPGALVKEEQIDSDRLLYLKRNT